MTTRPSENFLMRHAAPIATVMVAVVMIAVGVAFYQQSQVSTDARAWINHTYEVKAHIQALMSHLEDAQMGERGFILTGKDEYLAPYADAMHDSDDDQAKNNSLDRHHSVNEEIAILKDMTSDNPVQQQNIADMEADIHPFLERLALNIQQRRASTSDKVDTNIDLRPAVEIMARMRSDAKLMSAEENHLLALRVQEEESGVRQNRIIVFSSLGLFYILKVGAIWLYQRTRKRAQEEAARYTQQLERNEEELKIQQEELKASNEEIEASNEELEEQNAQIRQQTAELVRAKQQIEEKASEVELASKYKSEFLANMSHELRTPLNSLLILARSLAGNEEGNLTPDQVEEVRIIHNDGLELLNLINDILDLSKVEAGKLNVITENTPLDGIVERVKQQFAPIAKEKKVAFLVESEAGLPAALHTDAQRVEQILKNLLSNAFKFTEKGSVTLRIHRPETSTELRRTILDPARAVAFSVVDTGIGIEPSKFKDIFEAFQQEDGSTDRHYGGTGLGLTIARKFAHLLGGEVRVASEKGRGSVFTLVLPIEARTGEAVPEAPTELALLNARTELKAMPRISVTEFMADDRKNIVDKDKILLIIEDDEVFASVLMKIARKHGYKCLAAGNGKTGLLLAMEEPVTAIILDLKLPDIDGIQVLDQLKHDLRSRHIPVHIITGRTEGDATALLQKGAIGYLTKPVTMEGVEDALLRIETTTRAGMKQILVVEDDRNNQIALQNLLKKKDIQLTFTSTGQAGLDELKAHAFDCMILDLRLPDMTGFEWLEKAEKSASHSSLPPVIVYTAKELTEDENRQLNCYTGSIIIKGAKSPERLLDEVTLFLHSVESTLSEGQREMIRMQHDPDQVLQRRKVLMVDDDLRNTFALSKLLRKHGMEVVIADNGQMALEKLRSEAAIDLVIMDIMMPVMDGYEAMRAIRAQKKYENLPIIAITARAMPEEQEKCMAAGANDYLTKPVDIERLLTLLRVWLFRQDMAAA